MKKAIKIYVQYIGLEYDFYEKEGGGKVKLWMGSSLFLRTEYRE